jgi:hypothetical protein
MESVSGFFGFIYEWCNALLQWVSIVDDNDKTLKSNFEELLFKQKMVVDADYPMELFLFGYMT